MAYTTYEYYIGIYGGTVVPETEFQKLERKANQYINTFTFNRLVGKDTSEYPTLQDCACEMIEVIYNMTGISGNKKEKKSESTDGYSVTYVTEQMDGTLLEETLRRKLYAIARLYLQSTGLLYCGADVIC